MRGGLRIGALVASCALSLTAVAVAGAAERHDFITTYQRPGTSDYLVYYDELRRERFLESVAEELNRVLDLPATVTLRTAECGHSTTTWVAESHTVTVCYEYLDALLVIAANSSAARSAPCVAGSEYSATSARPISLNSANVTAPENICSERSGATPFSPAITSSASRYS